MKLTINPWKGMWIRPRETIREIVKTNPRYLFAVLSGIYGLPVLLQIAQNGSLGDHFSFGLILGASLLLAVFYGMLGISILSALLFWTGKWIGGTASYQEVRASVTWSNVPQVVNILIWGIWLGVFGNRLFSHSFVMTPFTGIEQGVIFLTYLVQTIISIWGFVICLHALGEVQGFSAWKALLNVAIPFFMILIVCWIATNLWYAVMSVPNVT